MNDIGSVGTAYVTLEADLTALGGQLSSAVQEGGQAGEKTGKAFTEGLASSVDVGPAIAQLGLFDQATSAVVAEARQMGLAFEQTSAIAVASADSMTAGFGPLFAAVEGVSLEAQQMGLAFHESEVIAVTSADSMTAAVAGTRGGFTQLAADLETSRAGINRFGSEAQNMGMALSVGVTLPLVGLSAAAISAYADIDSLKRGLTAVAGSAAEAEKQFADMKEVAKLPGLGLEEAVQGTIRLQAFGFSATESKTALLAFGNAIATVGGGKSELDRVIVQLGQMAGAGKVLQQDLRPIIEQVPQVAAIIKNSFGPDAIGEPGKVLDSLGISSKQFIATIVAELGKLPPVTGGIKNDIENMSDAVKISLAGLGESLAPAFHVISETVVPVMQGAVAIFKALPEPVQIGAIAIGGLAAALGPLLIAVGLTVKGFADVVGMVNLAKAAMGSSVVEAEALAVAETAVGTEAEVAATKIGAEAIAIDGAAASSKALGISLVAVAADIAIPAAAALLFYQTAKNLRDGIDETAFSLGGLTDQFAGVANAVDIAKVGTAELNTTYMEVPKAAQEAIKAQAELKKAYADAVAGYQTLLGAQAQGQDVAVALALAHDKVTEAFKKLNPQIAENEKAQKAATEALKADSTERNKQDALALTIFDQKKKALADLEAAQKAATLAGKADVDFTAQLQKAKDDLTAALTNLETVVHRNAAEQLAANEGTKQAADVTEKQATELGKVKQAATDYALAITVANQQLILHQIAATGVFTTLDHGVTVYHNVGAAMQQMAKDGTLTWDQVRTATQGALDTFVKVPDAITGVMTSIEVLKGVGIEKISTLADSIGGLKTAFLSVTDALNGTQSAVPQWVLNNTVAIVNGVHVVSDAAKALFASNTALAQSQEKVAGAQQDVNTVMIAGQPVLVTTTSTTNTTANAARDLATAADQVAAGMQGAGSASGAAVSGIEAVGDAAVSAGGKLKGLIDEFGEFKTGVSGTFGPSMSLAAGYDPSKPPSGQAPNVGDTKSQQWVPTPDGSFVFGTNIYTQAEIDLINAGNKVKAALTDVGDQWTDWSFLIQGEMLRTGKSADEIATAIIAQRQATDQATTSIQANTVAVADNMKQADQATPTVSDLTDQLWRLVDAGQGGSQAATALRQQIADMTAATSTVSNAYSDATAATQAFGTAIQVVSDVAVAAVVQTTAATQSAKAALGIVAPTPANPVSVPSAPTGSRAGLVISSPSTWYTQGQAPTINIFAQDANSIGQQVTQILRGAGIN